MLEENVYSSLLKSPSMNRGPPVVISLTFLCHLDDSILGREATDLMGNLGENKQSVMPFFLI